MDPPDDAERVLGWRARTPYSNASSGRMSDRKGVGEESGTYVVQAHRLVLWQSDPLEVVCARGYQLS
jgi:hypothetical protein